MENIKKWFEEQKDQNPDLEIVLEKVIESISERGFDSTHLNQLIEQELDKLKKDYENEFIQNIDNNAQDDTN